MEPAADVLACSGVGMAMWWPLGAVLSIGFWALLIGGGIVLARRSGVLSAAPGAEETLARRYASGDIAEDEYRRRLATLRDDTDAGERV